MAPERRARGSALDRVGALHRMATLMVLETQKDPGTAKAQEDPVAWSGDFWAHNERRRMRKPDQDTIKEWELLGPDLVGSETNQYHNWR